MSSFKLCEVSETDHAWLVDLHNDPVVLRNITHPSPITLDQHLRWWSTIDQVREIRLIFTTDGERAGFCKFYKVDSVNRNCVLGADLHADYRGKGLAKEMWKLMIHHCFHNLDLHRVALTTAEYNVAAQKVYRGLGFLDEGRLTESLFRDGKFYDQLLLYKTNDSVKIRE